jgi:hypothetical protein
MLKIELPRVETRRETPNVFRIVYFFVGRSLKSLILDTVVAIIKSPSEAVNMEIKSWQFTGFRAWAELCPQMTSSFRSFKMLL